MWVESTEKMSAGTSVGQRLNKIEGKTVALGASVLSCPKEPRTSREREMNRWNARKHRG